MSVCLKLHKRHLTGDSRQTSLARGAGEEQRENLLYVTKYYTAALFKKASKLCNQKDKTDKHGAKRALSIHLSPALGPGNKMDTTPTPVKWTLTDTLCKAGDPRVGVWTRGSVTYLGAG